MNIIQPKPLKAGVTAHLEKLVSFQTEIVEDVEGLLNIAKKRFNLFQEIVKLSPIKKPVLIDDEIASIQQHIDVLETALDEDIHKYETFDELVELIDESESLNEALQARCRHADDQNKLLQLIRDDRLPKAK